MMEHVEEGVLQALLDGELDEEEGGAIRAHLGRCTACEAELTALREASSTLTAALTRLDRPAPVRVLRMPPPSMAARGGRRFATALPRAAVLLLGFAVAGSATIPGSPVRSWIQDRLNPPAPERVEAMATTAAEPMSGPTERGVGITPLDGQLRIVLTGAREGLPVRVQLTSEPVGGAYSIGESAQTRFRSAGGLVEVVQPAGEELRVEIPIGASEASLEVDGRTAVLKDGDGLRLMMGEDEALARDEILFRIGG